MVVYEYDEENSTAEMSEELSELLSSLLSVRLNGKVSTSYADKRAVEITVQT